MQFKYTPVNAFYRRTEMGEASYCRDKQIDTVEKWVYKCMSQQTGSPYQAIPGNDQIASLTNQKAAGSKLERTS